VAKQVLLNVRYFMGAADLTGQSNKVELDDTFEEKETTTYGDDGAKRVLAGLESVAIASEGLVDRAEAAAADALFWSHRRIVEAHTVCPETSAVAVGTVAYLTQAVRLAAKLLGAVGDVEPWTASAAGSWPLARGVVLSAPGNAVTADADGTAIELGAVPAGKRLYGAAHVLSVAGTMAPELTVIVESDSAEAFDASPETRLTFATATAAGSEAVRSTSLAGHADTWYRASFDVEDNGGVGESFLVVVAVGIA
jgi:hypothetical protein